MALSVLAAPEVRYVDPLADLTGLDELNAFIGQAQQQFAGLAFRPGAAVDAHHKVARFGWELAPGASSEAAAVGFDVIETGDDGRITRVTGFLDRVPQ